MLLYQEDAELLFPPRVIPGLRNLRGQAFQTLIDHILTCKENDIQLLGFMLMMVRISSCITCTSDSYRAMNGCTRCAQKSIRGFKGTDEELVQKWQAACADVERWRKTGIAPGD